jgi:hypothetical protein
VHFVERLRQFATQLSAGPDATLEQVMEMVVGIAKIPSTQPGHVEQILDVALDGLRAIIRR